MFDWQLLLRRGSLGRGREFGFILGRTDMGQWRGGEGLRSEFERERGGVGAGIGIHRIWIKCAGEEDFLRGQAKMSGDKSVLFF